MKLFNRTLPILAATLTLASSAYATPIPVSVPVTFNLGTHINGATPPANGSTPLLTATFTDKVLTNGSKVVELVMTNNLATGEFVTDWLFNLDPAITSFNVSHVSGFTAGIQYAPNNVDGGSSIQAGNFDLDFTGGTAAASRFTGGMTSVYDFSATGLTASSFAFTSSSGYYSAADVKGIPVGGSGSIGTKTYNDTANPAGSPTSIPEPASLMLIGLGLASLTIGKRRNKHKDTV